MPEVDPPTWNLDRALETLDVRRVPFQLLEGNTQGYSLGREFAINPVAVDPTNTTFHELAHIALGHTAPAAAEEYRLHRGVAEFQAEATAYLCLKETELLTPAADEHSRGYIQHWLRGRRPDDQAVRAVFAATDSILRAGRVHDLEQPKLLA